MVEDKKMKAVPMENIESLVYNIRGQQVMLDTDLAEFYGYEVKYLNRQVKRNIERFPKDFMFQITKQEMEELRCQNVTANINPMSRTLPYVFSEQGIYMLATVLKSELAVQQSIVIIRAFKNMRHYILENRQLASKEDLRRIAMTVGEYKENTDKAIINIQKRIDALSDTFIPDADVKNLVIYRGQKFEADKAYIDIYQKAKKSIYVVDNYVNIKTLHLLSHKKTGVHVILFTENGFGQSRDFLTSSEVTDFDREYPTIRIKPNPDCHDRFIVIDYGTKTEKVFHCGSSSKDAGKKVCAINAIENTALVHPIVDALLLNSDINL
ncbi:MAG: ORF6N domain-containing protein [Clostridiales bacterium]|nr:ORF6N domain-containing protein [Clostridiales bacterium]